MPDYRLFYEKDYIGAWNIPESGELTLTIVKCVQGELNNPGTKKKTKKPVVYVQETDKGFALNVTNGKTIAGLYGNKVENWPGKRITLYKSMTRSPAGGDDVECLRVRPKVPASGAQSQPKTAAPAQAEDTLAHPHTTAAAPDAAVRKSAAQQDNQAGSPKGDLKALSSESLPNTSGPADAAAPTDDDLVASIKTLLRAKDYDEAQDLARSIKDEATRTEAIAFINSRKSKAA